MRHKRLIVALMIAVFVAGIQIKGADASSTVITETTKEAYATFDLHEKGLRTSVDINVAETETTSAEGSNAACTQTSRSFRRTGADVRAG